MKNPRCLEVFFKASLATRENGSLGFSDIVFHLSFKLMEFPSVLVTRIIKLHGKEQKKEKCCLR